MLKLYYNFVAIIFLQCVAFKIIDCSEKQEIEKLSSPKNVIANWNANFQKSFLALQKYTQSQTSQKKNWYNVYTTRFDPNIPHDFTSEFIFSDANLARITYFPKITLGKKENKKNYMTLAWDMLTGRCLQLKVTPWPHKTKKHIVVHHEILQEANWPQITINPHFAASVYYKKKQYWLSVSVNIETYTKWLKDSSS